MKSIRLILVTLLLFLLIGNSVIAATNSYTIGRALTASGGGLRASEGYSTRDIIGQTAVGLSSSEDYLLYSGFFGPYKSVPAPIPEPVPPEEPTVGGKVYMVNKIGILFPWIVLALAIVAGAVMSIRKRRAQG